MNDLLMLGNQISAEYREEKKKTLIKGFSKLILVPVGIFVALVLVEYLLISLLEKLMEIWPIIICVLYTLVVILGLIILAVYGIIQFVRYAFVDLVESVDNTNDKYMKKMTSSVFCECFERTIKESNFNFTDGDNEKHLYDKENKGTDLNLNGLSYYGKEFSFDKTDSVTSMSVVSDRKIGENFKLVVRQKEKLLSDGLYSQKDFIAVDNHSFITKFDTYCTDKIAAFKILTPEILNKLIEVNEAIKIFSISMDNNLIELSIAHDSVPISNTDKSIEASATIYEAKKQADAVELMIRTLLLLNKNNY